MTLPPAGGVTIRNAVVHLHNEQPLLADLFSLPTAADACLVCTNLRMLNGSRPVFVDRTDSTFLFPLGHVRFVEIPSRPVPAADEGRDEGRAERPPAEPEAELEIDEELLRRVREA